MYTPCNYTMSAFYKSISLSRIIHVDKINDLNSSEQTVLKDELKVAIEEMKFMVARVKKEQVSTENETWLHKVNKKINICNQFIRIINLQKEKSKTYKTQYEDTFKNLLINKLGVKTYEAMEQKAHMLTITELMES